MVHFVKSLKKTSIIFFLFHCEKYEAVRSEKIKNIKRQEENWKFSEIMRCEEPASTKQLAWFVFKAFEIRTKLLE